MSDHVTEEKVPNLDLVKEEVEIEEDQDINVMIKEESHESGQSPESFPLHPTEASFNCDVNGQFSCEVCEKKFEHRSRINSHMVKHSEERHHKCSDCDYAAKRKGDLIKHIDINHPAETTFRCEVCLKAFSTLSLLKQHSASHNEDRLFNCIQCSTTYKTKQGFRNHKAIVHESKGSFRCEVCGQKYLCQSKLDEHMERHNEERKHKCSDCDYSAKSKGDLTMHVRKRHPTETPYECQVCSKSFAILSLLKQHSVTHNEEKRFQCDQCSRTYKYQKSLRDHKAIVHENEGSFRCEVCGNKYLRQSKLDEHMVKHNEERKHKCSDCDYSAKSKRDLIGHIRIRHPTETPYQCQVCSKSFAILSLLKRHSVSHNEEKLFKCDHCSTTYKSKISLRNHKAIVHENEGRFRCEVCASRFLFRSNFEQHMVTHNKEGKHKCSKSKRDPSNHLSTVHSTNQNKGKSCCDELDTLPLLTSQYSEEQPSNLQLHLPEHKSTAHHVTKPFKCKKCFKNCPSAADLRRHSFTHREDRSFRCKICPKTFKSRRCIIQHMKIVHKTVKKIHPFRLKASLDKHVKDDHGTEDLKVGPVVIYDPGKNREISKAASQLKEEPSEVGVEDMANPTETTLQFEVNHDETNSFNSTKDVLKVEEVETPEETELKEEEPGKGEKVEPLEKRDVSNVQVKEEPEKNNYENQEGLSEAPLQCEVCSKSYSSLSLLRRHSAKHGEERSFKCDQCPGAFKQSKDLKNHKLLVHGGGGKFNCEVCGMKILFKGKYKRHMLRHSDEKSHKCGECGSAFKSKSGLNKHVLVNHATETPFECKVCSKSFATLRILNFHSMKHGGEKPFKCDQCSEAFKLKPTLRNHKVLVHDGGGKFPCGVCGSKFLYRAQLNEHMVRHSTERNFKCSECEYAAKRKNDLEKHMASHSSERNHKCGACGSAFKTKLSLNSHFRLVHHIKTPFQCEECLTSYAALSLLKRHCLYHGPRRVGEFEEIDLKVEPSVISNMKQETQEKEVKNELEYMEDVFPYLPYSDGIARHVKLIRKEKYTKEERAETFEDVEVKGGETFDDVKVESVMIYDPVVTHEDIYIKNEIEEEIGSDLEQGPEEIDWN